MVCAWSSMAVRVICVWPVGLVPVPVELLAVRCRGGTVAGMYRISDLWWSMSTLVQRVAVGVAVLVTAALLWAFVVPHGDGPSEPGLLPGMTLLPPTTLPVTISECDPTVIREGVPITPADLAVFGDEAGYEAGYEALREQLAATLLPLVAQEVERCGADEVRSALESWPGALIDELDARGAFGDG